MQGQRVRCMGKNEPIDFIPDFVYSGSKGAIPLARETDVNVLTSLLKLYFRELPEALFCDHLYAHFWDGMSKYP